jgi:hypothetical protein
LWFNSVHIELMVRCVNLRYYFFNAGAHRLTVIATGQFLFNFSAARLRRCVKKFF